MDADAALRIREAFAEAALRPEAWPDALSRLARECRAHLALGQMVGEHGFAAVMNPEAKAVIDSYVAQGWHEHNPRMERGMALTRSGRRGLITEQMMLTAQELATHPFQQEFAAEFDIQHEAGSVMAAHHGSMFILTIQRGMRSGPYEGRELDAMNRLAATLAETCSFALRMKLAHASSLVETFSARGEAMALLSPNGSSLFHTAGFERLLGERIVLRAGRVHGADPRADAELQALIARAGKWPEPAAHELTPVVVPRAVGRPLVVRCHPVAGAARDFLGLARTILVVDDLAAQPRPPTPDLAAKAFVLTPAEARLAARMAAGETLREAAEGEAITYESARTRLKSIFLKTGTDRQAELALLVSRVG